MSVPRTADERYGSHYLIVSGKDASAEAEEEVGSPGLSGESSLVAKKTDTLIGRGIYHHQL
jgi:hypothetical protein